MRRWLKRIPAVRAGDAARRCAVSNEMNCPSTPPPPAGPQLASRCPANIRTARRRSAARDLLTPPLRCPSPGGHHAGIGGPHSYQAGRSRTEEETGAGPRVDLRLPPCQRSSWSWGACLGAEGPRRHGTSACCRAPPACVWSRLGSLPCMPKLSAPQSPAQRRIIHGRGIN